MKARPGLPKDVVSPPAPSLSREVVQEVIGLLTSLLAKLQHVVGVTDAVVALRNQEHESQVRLAATLAEQARLQDDVHARTAAMERTLADYAQRIAEAEQRALQAQQRADAETQACREEHARIATSLVADLTEKRQAVQELTLRLEQLQVAKTNLQASIAAL